AAVEQFHDRGGAEAGAGDDLSLLVAVGVAGRDVDAAGEGRVVGVEAGEDVQVVPAEDLDVRPTAAAGAGDDIGVAVAVHVAAGHEHASGEGRVIGVEAQDLVAVGAVEDLDVRAAEVAGRGD